MASLTHKQRLFACHRANGDKVLEAYRKVYDVRPDRSDDSVYTEAANAESNTKVKQAQELLAAWISQRWLLESADARDWALSKLYEEACFAGKANDRIHATELILRAHGGLTDRKEIIHFDASDLDNAALLLRGAMTDLGLGECIDVDYVHSQQVTTPSQGVALCDRCRAEIRAEDPAAPDAEPPAVNPDTP